MTVKTKEIDGAIGELYLTIVGHLGSAERLLLKENTENSTPFNNDSIDVFKLSALEIGPVFFLFFYSKNNQSKICISFFFL